MLKTAVHDGTEKLGLQQKVTETGRMHTNISLLNGLFTGSTSGGGILSGSVFNGLGTGGDLEGLLVLFIINKFVSRVSHI